MNEKDDRVVPFPGGSTPPEAELRELAREIFIQRVQHLPPGARRGDFTDVADFAYVAARAFLAHKPTP